MKVNSVTMARNLMAIAISSAVTASFAADPENKRPQLEEVLVTGSHIKSSAGDEALPVQVLDRDYIDSIGATTVADVVAKLAINSGAENQADSFTQNATQGTGNVNLRGLGLSSTLVLINGRRQTHSGALANDGSVFVDTSTIPVNALERVEVLKEGAASAYGSDAIAGVVNFILRKDYQGFELSAGIQNVEDGGQTDQSIGFITGGGNDRTHFTIAANYMDRDALSSADRPELVDNSISSLGNAYLLLDSSTVTDGPYAGDYAAYEYVPQANCEQSEGGVLIPQASGARCGFHYGPRFNLVNEETRTQIYGNLTHDFDNGIGLLAELGWSNNEVKDNPQSPSYPDLSFPYISSSHPDNPFGVGAVWFGRPLGSEFESPLAPRENETLRASLNLAGGFSNGWSWDTALTYSENSYKFFQPDTIQSRLSAAFAGNGGPNNDEYYNPFDPSSVSQSLIDDFSYQTEAERKTDLTVFDAVVAGELFSMGSGMVELAAGVQARRDGFSVTTDDLYEIKTDANGETIPVDLIFLGGFSHVDTDRDAYSVFAEAKFPVTENLEVTAALRYEDLENDSSVDPKLALRWRISDQVILRASASTAFREPSLSQQHANSVGLQFIADPLSDSSAFVRIAAQGSTELDPEESENFNIGVIYQPTDTIDFKLDYWRVDYTDLITIENAQSKIFNDPNGPDIVRDSLGNLAGVNVDYFNSSDVEVEGIDFESTWSINAAWYMSLNVSHFLTYDITTATGETVDALGMFNNEKFVRSLPETKANFNVGWRSELQRVSLNTHYVSSYDHSLEVPDGQNKKIDSFTTVDAQYSLRLPLGIVGEDEAEFNLGVKNLLDEEPPRVFDGANLSYDPKQHSPLGRVYYANVTYRF